MIIVNYDIVNYDIYYYVSVYLDKSFEGYNQKWYRSESPVGVSGLDGGCLS